MGAETLPRSRRPVHLLGDLLIRQAKLVDRLSRSLGILRRPMLRRRIGESRRGRLQHAVVLRLECPVQLGGRLDTDTHAVPQAHRRTSNLIHRRPGRVDLRLELRPHLRVQLTIRLGERFGDRLLRLGEPLRRLAQRILVRLRVLRGCSHRRQTARHGHDPDVQGATQRVDQLAHTRRSGRRASGNRASDHAAKLARASGSEMVGASRRVHRPGHRHMEARRFGSATTHVAICRRSPTQGRHPGLECPQRRARLTEALTEVRRIALLLSHVLTE